jgi:hypothetical protein
MLFIAACIALFIAGTVADWLVVRATRHDPEAGLIVGLVAAGMGALVTLGIAVVAGLVLSGLALTLYLVATAPLVVGSLVRIVRAYRATHEAQRLVIAGQLAAMDAREAGDGN